MYDCRHNRARIYHVNQRALYTAIGEPDSRLRKPVILKHAIQRLMVLDAIVEEPDLVWLGTADEKATHLLALTRIAGTDLPHVTVGDGEQRRVRYFPDRLPIGIHFAGRGVVVYVVTDPWLDEFRVFLQRHAFDAGNGTGKCALPSHRSTAATRRNSAKLATGGRTGSRDRSESPPRRMTMPPCHWTTMASANSRTACVSRIHRAVIDALAV